MDDLFIYSYRYSIIFEFHYIWLSNTKDLSLGLQLLTKMIKVINQS